MQVNDKIDEQRSEAEGMAKHWIESPHFCFLILIFWLQLTSFLYFKAVLWN